MGFENIILEITIIFTVAALIASLFLYLKQSVLLSYIVAGMVVGPWGLALIKNPDHIDKISHIGIILLLFLIGIELHPERLIKLFKKTILLTLGTCTIFTLISLGFCVIIGFSFMESLIVGLALMFSSTVIGLKMIPENDEGKKHIAELMTSVLLLQDIIAVLVIMFVQGGNQNFLSGIGTMLFKLVFLLVCSYLFVKYIFVSLHNKFGSIQEYDFIISLAWCMLMAEASKLLGFSYELGAFIAGLSLATTPISHSIDEKLKPLKEFFLILFFFSIGAKFDLLVTRKIFIPGLILATILLTVKPLAYYFGFKKTNETMDTSKELAIRLGQCSEFSLLVSIAAFNAGAITQKANNLIQLVTIATFIISTYIVFSKYPQKETEEAPKNKGQEIITDETAAIPKA